MDSTSNGPSVAQSPARRHSMGSVAEYAGRRRPMTATRRSADAAPVAAISGPRTLSGGSNTMIIPPSLYMPTFRTQDWAHRPSVRDSGLATNSPVAHYNSFVSEPSPQIPPFELLQEHRRDLLRLERPPPPPPPPSRVRNPQPQRVLENRRRGLLGRARRVLAFFGYGTGNRLRRELVSLIWTLSFGSVQFIVTIAILSYSSVHHSPTQPSISEWKACDKPLGLWGCFWIVKVALDCCVTYWGWKREWKLRQGERIRSEGDVEEALPSPADRLSTDGQIDLATLDPADDRRRREASLPLSKLYSRLSLSLSLIIISWFLTSNILVFTSLHSCRFAAPHLWWLIFSILCLQYLIILEVFAIALLVFIIGPLIYLFWNIILLCLGRHPVQNPHYINPEIGGLPKKLVDQIPLVLYIPSPPGDDLKGTDELAAGDGTITKPEPAYTTGEHTYPPKSPPPKRRFTFLRKSSSRSFAALSASGAHDEKADGDPRVWEDCWEHGEFPFVRLTENRASCAICLLDFEEPRRRVAREVIKLWAQNNGGNVNGETVAARTEAPQQVGTYVTSSDSSAPNSSGRAEDQHDIQEVPASRNTEARASVSSLRLEDAGEGPQPLRLLECGHVFHKTCVDPWLVDVSGRCPTCQRPVVMRTSQKKRDRDRS
ncbi:hypothetical protein M0805_001686 [Coniferiporia weirii]|nr:hypothetical protein M0805_001686 [Coniferiporia weirii]